MFFYYYIRLYLIFISISLNSALLEKSYNINYLYGKEYIQYLKDYNLITYILNDSGKNKEDIYNNIIDSRKENYYIFENNLRNIKEFNKHNDNIQLDINQFADKIDYKKEYPTDLMNNLLKNIDENTNLNTYYLNNDINNIINWKDYLSPVKNQGYCGSCWAFSSTSGLESNMRIKGYNVSRLSEQELVDFSTENYGCNGGLMHLAYNYIINKEGLVSNEDYPYLAKSTDCNINNTSIDNLNRVNGSKIIDYYFTIPKSSKSMINLLQKGPISIALDASNFAFRFYKKGIIDIPSNQSSEINHAVLLTGYEKDENGYYWIIQNSWGETWGDNGFAKIRVRPGEGSLLSQIYGVYPVIN